MFNNLTNSFQEPSFALSVSLRTLLGWPCWTLGYNLIAGGRRLQPHSWVTGLYYTYNIIAGRQRVMTSYLGGRGLWPLTWEAEGYDLSLTWEAEGYDLLPGRQRDMTSYLGGRGLWPLTCEAEGYDLLPGRQRAMTSYLGGRGLWPLTWEAEGYNLTERRNTSNTITVHLFGSNCLSSTFHHWMRSRHLIHSVCFNHLISGPSNLLAMSKELLDSSDYHTTASAAASLQPQ